MKKGFLVYFDNCRQTEDMPDHLYAAVWRANFTYGELLARGEDAEGYLKARLSSLPKEGRMALRFMSDNARRDHERYRERTEELRAAQKRNKERRDRPVAPAPDMDDAWKYVGRKDL